MSRICSFLLALGLVVVMLPTNGLAEPHVWPAWRAMTADGEEFSSRQLDGKVVVMTMWASWCPSCRKQLPVLDALQDADSELLPPTLVAGRTEHVGSYPVLAEVEHARTGG